MGLGSDAVNNALVAQEVNTSDAQIPNAITRKAPHMRMKKMLGFTFRVELLVVCLGFRSKGTRRNA